MDNAPLLRTGDEEIKEERSPWPKRVAIVVTCLAIIGVVWYFWPEISAGVHAFMDMIASWGLASIPVITLCCILTTTTCLPLIYIFEFGAGVIYYRITGSSGMALVYSCVAVCPGVYIGSLGAFAIGRRWLKPVVKQVMDENVTLTIVNQIVSEEGWPFAFLLGLNPAIPFELLNYALSMTDLSFGHFMISSLGVMPVVAFETYTGVAVSAVADSLQGESSSSMWEPIIQFSIVAILIISMGIYAKKKFNVKAAQRRQNLAFILKPHFLIAVGKFLRTKSQGTGGVMRASKTQGHEWHFEDRLRVCNAVLRKSFTMHY
eukprot:TRINITY_DN8215_c0_g1_i1.p1 TRINITY_DN8215_c0_g1~~TRINITY_DN8215_c0_g1_i1.p1  ORF type:complete len:318 (-),score=23.03 TRINITY_DN8215_c0_g1_i1:65-1018(-)